MYLKEKKEDTNRLDKLLIYSNKHKEKFRSLKKLESKQKQQPRPSNSGKSQNRENLKQIHKSLYKTSQKPCL